MQLWGLHGINYDDYIKMQNNYSNYMAYKLWNYGDHMQLG